MYMLRAYYSLACMPHHVLTHNVHAAVNESIQGVTIIAFRKARLQIELIVYCLVKKILKIQIQTCGIKGLLSERWTGSK